jgi:hypothetical protein
VVLKEIAMSWRAPDLIQDIRSKFRDTEERRDAANMIQWLSDEEKFCGADFATVERQQQAALRDKNK